MTINTTKLVTDMAVEKGIDPLLSQVGWPIFARSATHGYISELKATLTFLEPVVSVTPLQITNNQAASRTVVGVVTKRLHRLAHPTFVIRNPTVVGGKFRKVTNQRLHEILPPTDRVDIPPRNQDSFIVRANVVPVLGILDGPVCHFEVGLEKVRFQHSVLTLETLADRLLIIAIPADVRARVGRAKLSLARDFVAVDLDAVGCEVGPGRRRVRHIILLGA